MKPCEPNSFQTAFAVRRFPSECAVDGAQRRRFFWHFRPSFLAQFLGILMSKNAPNFLYERPGAQFLNYEMKKGQLLRKLVSYMREPTVLTIGH